MSDQLYLLLSLEWIDRYREIWNTNDKAIQGTKGMDMLVQMEATDRGRPPVQLHIDIDGHADYAGPIRTDGREPDFALAAPSGTWAAVARKEMGVRRAVMGPIAFKGSLAKALKHFSGLEAALHQFADVPTDWDR
jgi:putative sterol carrier protein